MAKLDGHEFKALNPTRSDSKVGSFSINIRTGAWGDFATGDKGGDLVSLYAYAAKHRLYVNTRTTACSGNAQQTKAADTGGIGGSGERVCRAELDRETEQNIWRDYAEVAAGANACKMLLELVENNFEVIR